MTSFKHLLPCLALAACGVDHNTITDTPDGLTLTQHDRDGMRGTFASDGSTIAFELVTEGSEHHVRFSDAVGHLLSDNVVNATSDAATVFDPAQLAGLPEASLVSPLAEALRVNNGPIPTTAPPQAAPDAFPVTWTGCNSWVPPGGVASCGTTFFGYSSIWVENPNGQLSYFHYWSQGFNAPPPGEAGTGTFVGPNNSVNLGGWWWGQWVFVWNDGPNWLYVTH